MAFVLIQHLDPKHQSLMVDLLSGHTPMMVRQVLDGMAVEIDHVYLIPPGTSLAIEHGTLKLSKPAERHGARMPFDFFLRSLAEDCGARAICAVLSGTGTDGSLGLKAVKEKGGLVIVQDPDEAAFDGMPRSAITSGVADLVLSVAQMPAAILKYARQSYVRAPPEERGSSVPPDAGFVEIIALLASTTAHDFTLYKQGTLQRRIERRMALAGLESAARYLQVLADDASERELLAKDLLINVTHFFRDPAVFEVLNETVVAELVAQQTLDRPLRIWIPGCSTGEEAYSITMLFLEQIAAAKRNIKLQVFASDIDASSVACARNGIYPESIAADVTPTRLARFFVKDDHTYQVVRDLREAIVFTRQSLLTDAPFSRLDLISCRNLLIYLSPEAQHKVLSLFHFGLRQGGVLFLGSSETVGRDSDRFEPINKKLRIYRHIGHNRIGDLDFSRGRHVTGPAPAPVLSSQSSRRRPGLGELSQLVLLDAYAPASVLINAKYEGLHFIGSTDRYLKVASGDDTRDVLVMARDGLRAKLRTAIRQVREQQVPSTVLGAQMKRDGNTINVSMTVRPVDSEGEPLFLVSFVDEPLRETRPNGPVDMPADASRIAFLEQDLEAVREDLQSAVRELEIANQEQKAINEEAMSVNEEFQSTNEELETSKEELQSLNEELTALNSQLHETVEQHRATSNDLQNILNSTDVATIFLDAQLKIRFFTPAAKSLLNVIASDVGRPMSDLTRRFADDDFVADARAVLLNQTPIRREVKSDDGDWFNRGMLPYRSEDKGIEGLVITFAGISEIKAAELEIEVARAYLDSIIATIRQPLVVLDDDLRAISASSSFYRLFSVEPEQLVGRNLLSSQPHLNVPELRDFLTSTRDNGASVADHKVELDLPNYGHRAFLMSARVLREAPLAKRKILVAIVDVTETKKEGEALEAAKLRAERANLGKSRFLAAASHDLRQPLQTINLLQGMLEKRIRDEPTLKLVRRLNETVNAMASMLDKLLDINQLEAGIVRPAVVDFPIKQLLDEMQTVMAYHTEATGLGWRVMPCSITVRSDPRLLEQIIRNLVSNAIKYTSEGRIVLGCRRRGDMLRIDICDTGTGIPETELKAIFEEFHQLENPARERSKGLGLGLAIVQRLANLLGHKINVRTHQGVGSTFSIEVPIGSAAPAALSGPGSVDAALTAPIRGTLLIVEDDPTMLELSQSLLESEGYRTLVAANGEAALRLVARRAAAPDLILADYNLPMGLNGVQTIEMVRRHYGHAVPAIILTGDIAAASLRTIAESGCTHLSKPVSANDLTQLVSRLLSKALATTSVAVAPERVCPRVPRVAGQDAPILYIVDDDAELREGLRDLLRDDDYRVEVFADGASFFAAYQPGKTECLLVDAQMPGMSGIELIERLRAEGHTLPAIVITGHGDVPLAVQSMRAGAVDFIEKPVGHVDLLSVIARVLDATPGVSPRSTQQDTASTRIASLTTRQRQILDLVLAGHPSKNIAADIGISQRTVDNHRAAIMRKTGSKSLSALIRTALDAA